VIVDAFECRDYDNIPSALTNKPKAKFKLLDDAG